MRSNETLSQFQFTFQTLNLIKLFVKKKLSKFAIHETVSGRDYSPESDDSGKHQKTPRIQAELR